MRSDSITPVIGLAKWADGTVWTCPTIQESDNRWFYRPDEARTKAEIATGKNKTFGLGFEGDRLAKQWIRERFTTFPIEKGRPAFIDTAGSLDDYWYLRTDETAIRVVHPQLGLAQVEMKYGIDLDRFGHNAQLTVTYHPLVHRIVTGVWKTVVGHRFNDVVVALTVANTTDSVNRFWNDPFSYLALSDEYQPNEGSELALGVFKELRRGLPAMSLKWEQKRIRGGHDVPWETWVGTSVWMGTNDHAQRFLETDFDKIAEMFEALSAAAGVKFRLMKTGGQTYGVSMEIPKQPKTDGREEFHTIVIETSGVRVQCGFREDERRFIEYEKRRASQFLQELGQWNEESIDL